jgi:hypothetical protein
MLKDISLLGTKIMFPLPRIKPLITFILKIVILYKIARKESRGKVGRKE